MQVIQLDTIDSTNAEAKRLIHAGRITGPAYVIAREQTAGKGRRGRAWVSPKDAGIYLTVVELPGVPIVADVSAFTLATGVACVEALHDATGVQVQLKPVNDLYVDGRKLGGILTETVMRGDVLEALIIGVGINIQKVERNVPAGAVQPICLMELLSPQQRARRSSPTHCFAMNGAPKLDVEGLTVALVERIRAWTEVVLRGETAKVEAAWERHKLPGTTLPKGE